MSADNGINANDGAPHEDVTAGGDTVENEGAATGADEGAEAQGEKADDGPSSMLDAVSGAVEKLDAAKADTADDEPLEDSPTSSGTERDADASASEANDEAAREEDPGHFSRKEWRNLSPKTRERIEWFRQQKRELSAEVERYRPIALEVEQSGINQKDFEILLGLGKALQQGDAETFLAGVMPYVELMQEFAGQKLPEDLQQKVDDGYTTPEIAAELARARHSAQLERSRAEAVTNRVAEQDRQAQLRAVLDQVRQYEDGIRTRDPDYAKKRDVIERETERLVRAHGLPTTPEEGLKIAKAAYEFANSVFSKAVPRHATRPTPSGSQRTSGTVRQQPSNMLEAIEMGLSRNSA